MDAAVKAKALETLDGMAEIIRNEAIVHGRYATPVVNPDRMGSLCRGRTYCLIGSLWHAHGDAVIEDQPDTHNTGRWTEMEGTGDSQERDDYLATRPALRLAYDVLNRHAADKVDQIDPCDDLNYEAETMYGGSIAEAYFEVLRPGSDTLLELVSDARKEIEAA